MKALVCPVCNGSGKYQDRLGNAPDATLTVTFRNCHGCAGKGWVEVSGDEPGGIRYYYPSYLQHYGWCDQYGIWHTGY